jgi:hypothetical protein
MLLFWPEKCDIGAQQASFLKKLGKISVNYLGSTPGEQYANFSFQAISSAEPPTTDYCEIVFSVKPNDRRNWTHKSRVTKERRFMESEFKPWLDEFRAQDEHLPP